MAISKTTKVQAEIEKAKAKLADQQARVKELENKHTELENIEIVDIVRGLKIPLNELAATLQLAKAGSLPTAATTSGQIGPKQKKMANNKTNTDIEADVETDMEDEDE